MHLQVPPQNTPLLWQLNSHKHISSLPELLRCCTIIVVTLNLMYVQVFKLRRKSHSLLDDPRTIRNHSYVKWEISKITNRQITKSTYGSLSEQLFPKSWLKMLPKPILSFHTLSYILVYYQNIFRKQTVQRSRINA